MLKAAGAGFGPAMAGLSKAEDASVCCSKAKQCMTVRSVVVVAAVLGLIVCGECVGARPWWTGARTSPKLFMPLPDYCNTPDGMTLEPITGNIILSCPNFNDTTYPGVLMKIDRANKLSLFYPMPVHPETKRGCPMGLDFGPDGNLYVADNQYFYDKEYKSRLIRVLIRGGIPLAAEVVVEGFKLSNAVIWNGESIYVSETYFDLPDRPGSSGIYRFKLGELQKGTVRLKPDATDPHLIATFTTKPNKRGDVSGADGLTFDSKGNLYTGNFGDGVMYKITFDKSGRVTSNEVFVKDPKLTCVDGLFCDVKTDEIYVADMEKNAIQIVSSSGEVRTLWENADTDGTGGRLDGPCESLMRGDELIVANFDMPLAGLRNTKHDRPHTLSVIKLKDQ